MKTACFYKNKVLIDERFSPYGKLEEEDAVSMYSYSAVRFRCLSNSKPICVFVSASSMGQKKARILSLRITEN